MEQSNNSPTQISGALRREQLRMAQEVDSICDKFERAWQQGESPSVGEFLKSIAGAANTDRPASTLFLELVKIDVEYRAKRGETPDLELYAREFPSYRALLSDVVPAEDLGATKIRPLQQVDTLERFVLQGRLGAGTFGVVWKAWAGWPSSSFARTFPPRAADCSSAKPARSPGSTIRTWFRCLN